MSACLVFCACPDADSAARIADALVASRLAACVTALPQARSTYRWQGEIEHADEILLLIKTERARVAAMSERIVALHPYELPEVIAVEADAGLPAYLDWIAAETRDGVT